MEDKKIDNKIIQTKKEIKIIEDDLTRTKKALKEIEYLEDNITHLNRNLNQCVELINLSIKNKNVSQKINTISNDTIINYKKTSLSINEEKEITTKKINELNEKKELLNDELKKINEEKEENKEQE